jgi:hypothetical protein
MISKTSPTWSWFVGMEGNVVWTVGTEDLPIRDSVDLPFFRASAVELEKLSEEVDVVLCQGFKPGAPHTVWKLPETRAVLWFNHGFRGGEVMPKGWVVTKRTLEHERLGGVTNARGLLFVTQRRGESSVQWKQPASSFSNTLGQVVDPTRGGSCVTNRHSRRKIPSIRPTDFWIGNREFQQRCWCPLYTRKTSGLSGG